MLYISLQPIQHWSVERLRVLWHRTSLNLQPPLRCVEPYRWSFGCSLHLIHRLKAPYPICPHLAPLLYISTAQR